MERAAPVGASRLGGSCVLLLFRQSLLLLFRLAG